ncbi:uncharacterized protein FIBRA_03003 [Fibroporia radiculosa]|uniref:F-box domain-containing protein n=1 Tax=Fibroporia radiculosa TaxID=599839 RepID=J4I9D2_9APHY|nr:uncharacterized protein FIBRA_03003 [Fibroporia radiculosa]CCM00956.1 predicted protein [Fibroporia radiculosa]
MSKKLRAPPATLDAESRPAKRRKTHGHRTVDDDVPTPQAQVQAPSPSALSTRSLPSHRIPTLASLSTRIFAENLQRLSADKNLWDHVRFWLKALPDALASRYFLRGTSVAFDGDLPGVNKQTLAAVRDSPIHASLSMLELSDFSKETDKFLASVILKLPSLKTLILRGCTKVGQSTADAIAKSCSQLTVLNLNYTSVTPISLVPVLTSCRHLEVLKIAGVPNWTDAAFAKLWAPISAIKDFKLTKLRSLKLRQTALSDSALAPFFAICPNLRRLDLSFTLVRHPSGLVAGKSLEKLALTSTKISSRELIDSVSDRLELKCLNIAMLGGGQGSAATISNSSAMSMTDQTLRDLTDVLEQYPLLDSINLVGNTKLGITGSRNSALADFIRRIGRRCKVLNLSNLTGLRSSDLEGLLPQTPEENPASLQILVLNNTAVGDEAASFISQCPHLESLAVGGTRFTAPGLFSIVDACPRLQKLDLTSCRGVKVGDRRRFFEVDFNSVLNSLPN